MAPLGTAEPLAALPPHAAARADHSRLLGQLAAALSIVAETARRLIAGRKRYRVEPATYFPLRELDARTLRDLGLDQNEILAAAIELDRECENTRLHAARASNARWLS